MTEKKQSKLNWDFVEKLAKPEVVNEFLVAHGVTLPAATIACLREHNGGYPSDDVFDAANNPECTFGKLFSYDKGGVDSIYDYYPDLFADTPLYPLSVDDFGNYICYDQEAKRPVFYDTESECAWPIDVDSNKPLFASLGLA